MTGPAEDRSQQILAAYLEQHEAGLTALRRQLHMRPEIGGHEVATTHAIEQRLQAVGLRFYQTVCVWHFARRKLQRPSGLM